MESDIIRAAKCIETVAIRSNRRNESLSETNAVIVIRTQTGINFCADNAKLLAGWEECDAHITLMYLLRGAEQIDIPEYTDSVNVNDPTTIFAAHNELKPFNIVMDYIRFTDNTLKNATMRRYSSAQALKIRQHNTLNPDDVSPIVNPVLRYLYRNSLDSRALNIVLINSVSDVLFCFETMDQAQRTVNQCCENYTSMRSYRRCRNKTDEIYVKMANRPLPPEPIYNNLTSDTATSSNDHIYEPVNTDIADKNRKIEILSEKLRILLKERERLVSATDPSIVYDL